MSSGSASTRGPYSATSASLISALVLPSLISPAMKSRSWSATADVETFSAVPHSRHITSSSMSGSEARGSAAVAACGASEREREQGGEQRAHHAFSSSNGGSVWSSHFCVTGKRRTAATRPWRSITKFSG